MASKDFVRDTLLNIEKQGLSYFLCVIDPDIKSPGDSIEIFTNLKNDELIRFANGISGLTKEIEEVDKKKNKTKKK